MKEINIARAIVNKRKEKGITQDDLANYIGVSKASVSKWETGQSYPDITFLPQLATYFNISIDELMGYTPQMAKEDIRGLYQKLSADFSKKPFVEVVAEMHTIIKKYYSCFSLLLQMVILMTNHYMLSQERNAQITILEEALTLCGRIKTESEDFHLNRQANSIEAILNLLLNRPNEVIDLLDVTMQPISQDEMTLASAYEMNGDIMDAKKTLQITGYQYVLYLVGSAVKLLPLYMNERERFEEILRRNLLVADSFNLETLHPNAYIQLSTTAAYCLTMLGDYDRALDFLKKSVDAYKNFEFPVMLHGDDYFDLLEEWFQNFDLGGNAPRDESLIKESLLEMITSSAFAPLFEMPKYKIIVDSVKNI